MGLRYEVTESNKRKFLTFKSSQYDYIFAVFSGKYKGWFCLIPSKVFKEKGIITETYSRTQIEFPYPDEEKVNNIKRHWWMQEFCFQFSDPNIVQIIIKLLTSY